MQDCNGWMGVTTLSWYFKTKWNVKHTIPHTGKIMGFFLYFSKINLFFSQNGQIFAHLRKIWKIQSFSPEILPWFFPVCIYNIQWSQTQDLGHLFPTVVLDKLYLVSNETFAFHVNTKCSFTSLKTQWLVIYFLSISLTVHYNCLGLLNQSCLAGTILNSEYIVETPLSNHIRFFL